MDEDGRERGLPRGIADAVVKAALDALERSGRAVTEPGDAEDTHYHGDPRDEAAGLDVSEPQGRTSGPEMLRDLRKHLDNLNLGRFSADGEWKTTSQDVDDIFQNHLKDELSHATVDKPL
jgi:hypothetical protein